MSAIEETIAMIKMLPEADVAKVENFTRKLVKRREHKREVDLVNEMPPFLKPMTLEDFERDIARAEEQYEKGEYRDFDEALHEINQELGL